MEDELLFGIAAKFTAIFSEGKSNYCSEKWVLHNNNALAKKPVTKMEHAPYSSDSPLRFSALSKIKKNTLKGYRLADSPDFQLNVETLLSSHGLHKRQQS
jgi:hypothetical protein